MILLCFQWICFDYYESALPTKLEKLNNICFIQVPDTIKKLKSDNRKANSKQRKKNENERHPALGALGVWEYGPNFYHNVLLILTY